MSSHNRQSFALFYVECRHIGQRFPTFQVEGRVILESAFRCSRSNVESHSTALSAHPSRMSNHIRQLFPTLQVECRVTLDSSFRSRSNVVSKSTARSAIPGRMSSKTRQPFFCFTSNVALSAVPGLISSHTRQRFPLLLFECRDTRHRFLLFKIGCRVTLKRYRPFQVECRVTLDSIFRPSSSNIESYSTALSVLPGRLSS